MDVAAYGRWLRLPPMGALFGAGVCLLVSVADTAWKLTHPTDAVNSGWLVASGLISGGGLAGLAILSLLVSKRKSLPVWAKASGGVVVAVMWTASYASIFLGIAIPLLTIGSLLLGGAIIKKCSEVDHVGWILALAPLASLLGIFIFPMLYLSAPLASLGLVTLTIGIKLRNDPTQFRLWPKWFFWFAVGLTALMVLAVPATGVYFYQATYLTDCAGLDVYPRAELTQAQIEELADAIGDIPGVSGISYSGPPSDPRDAWTADLERGIRAAEERRVNQRIDRLSDVSRVAPCDSDIRFPWL